MGEVFVITTPQIAEATSRYRGVNWAHPLLGAARNPRTARAARASCMAGILASVTGHSLDEAMKLYVSNDAFLALATQLADQIEAEKAEKAVLS